MPPKIAELMEKQDADQMTQKRSGATGKGTDDKFRVTLECRQAILGALGDGVPVGTQLPPILVVYGVHARLDNVSKDRRWKKDEKFEVAGEVIYRKAHEKIPNGLMKEWLKLRDDNEEMFDQIVVMQQPSATVDEVIAGWSMEDLAGRFPWCILQRDSLSGALTPGARLAAHLGQIICCWISPGMTPVVQLTGHRLIKNPGNSAVTLLNLKHTVKLF